MLFVCSGAFAESRTLPPVIDNSTYPAGSKLNSAASSNSSNAMYEVLERIDQLQQEIQQLRGVAEEQSQTIDDLKKRQSNIYSDLDQRIQVLVEESERDNLVNDNNSYSTVPVNNNLQNETVIKPNELENPAPKAQTMVGDKTITTERNQKTLYQEAYESLRNGHNTHAIAAFNSLITEFPGGEYSDNAQYWLGEAYKVNRDYNSAKQAFSKVALLYPDSPKVPDALLKLAYIELEQNNLAKANIYLTQLEKNHPHSNAAQLAKKKLIQLGKKLP